MRGKGNPIEILEKTSQSEPHPSPRPRDPWISWKKPHNLRTIPGTLEILEKTSQSADHPRDPENPGKKPHNITHLLGWLLLLVGWLVPTSCAEAPCRAITENLKN